MNRVNIGGEMHMNIGGNAGLGLPDNVDPEPVKAVSTSGGGVSSDVAIQMAEVLNKSLAEARRKIQVAKFENEVDAIMKAKKDGPSVCYGGSVRYGGLVNEFSL